MRDLKEEGVTTSVADVCMSKQKSEISLEVTIEENLPNTRPPSLERDACTSRRASAGDRV